MDSSELLSGSTQRTSAVSNESDHKESLPIGGGEKKKEEILSDCYIIIVMMTLLEPASLHRLEKSLSSYVGNTLNNNRSIITGTQISSGITQKQRSAKPGLQLGQYSSVRRASMLVFCPAMYL